MEAGTEPVGRLLDDGQLGGVSTEPVEGAIVSARRSEHETRVGIARPPTRWGDAGWLISFLFCVLFISRIILILFR